MNMSSKRQNYSLLQKLRYREITGVFDRNVKVPYNKALFLFGTIPNRFHFNVEPVLRGLRSHILMGLTQCGTFLITYSIRYRPSFSDPAIYQLYFWRFSTNFKIVLEKEVQLFQGYSVPYVPDVKFAQWPTVPDKLVIFGHSKNVAEPEARIYITITSVPSRENCKDCKAKRTGNILDACAKSCLKHGLTIHTVTSILAPCVIVKLFTAMKDENKLILNVGSHLHVFSFELKTDINEKNFNKKDSTYENDEKEELRHNIFSGLMVRHCDNFKLPILFTPRQNLHLVKWKSLNSDPVRMEHVNNDDKFLRLSNSKIGKSDLGPASTSKQTAAAEQFRSKIYEFADTEEHCNLKYKWYRRRTKADKMYEFCNDGDDDNMENIHPLSRYKLLSKKYRRTTTSTAASSLPSSTNSDVATDEEASSSGRESPNDDAVNTDYRINKRLNLSPVRNDKEPKMKCNNTNNNNNNNSSAAIHASGGVTVNQPADVVRSIDHYVSDTESVVVTVADDISDKKMSARLALKPCNLENNLNSDVVLTVDKSCSINATTTLTSSSHKNALNSDIKGDVKYFHTLTDVSTRFERYYVDEANFVRFKRSTEDMSEENIEDSNEFQGALPLLVLGSGDRIMKLIPNEKEVKELNLPYCVAVQDTLDMETFCFKACRTICTLENLQFLFVINYDVQIVDVCPLNGDILAVVYMHVQTESSVPRFSKTFNTIVNKGETCCIFKWNPKTGKCSLEAYTPFEHVTDAHDCFSSAKYMADKLKSFSLGFFGVPLKRKIRILNHRPGCSLKCIRDELHLICFHKSNDQTCYSTTNVLNVECYSDQVDQDSDSEYDDSDSYDINYDIDRLF